MQIYSVIDKELERLHELLKLTFSVETAGDMQILARDQILNLISDLYTMLEMSIPNFDSDDADLTV